MAAEFLNRFLAEQLIRFFVDDSSIQELFEGYNPLSTFSARIEISFALGLLTDQMKHDLTYIRKIRNHFAHHPDIVSFDVSPIKDWCKELTYSEGVPSNDGQMLKFGRTRDQYLITVTGVIVTIAAIMNLRPRCVLPEPPLDLAKVIESPS